MLKVYQVKCPIEHTDTELFQALCNKLKCRREDVVNWKIVKRSIDARKKPMLFYSYILLATCRNEEKIFRRLKKSADIMKDDTVAYRVPESGDKRLR